MLTDAIKEWQVLYYVCLLGAMGSLVLLGIYLNDELWRIRMHENGYMRIFSWQSIFLKIVMLLTYALMGNIARQKITGELLIIDSERPLLDAMFLISLSLFALTLHRLWGRCQIRRHYDKMHKTAHKRRSTDF